MVSAATNNSKATEKPAESGNESPLNTILTIIEHKIRNLEKRKTKLDGYKELQKSGEKLTTDQKEAVKKYDEVRHSLDLAKEFCKQFSQIVREANREAKKEAKRNQFLRIQQESAKIREVLVIQDILRSLADENVRQDFLDGTNGAVKIDQADMNLLEKLYVEVNPKRPTRTDEPTFAAAANHSANTFSSVIDATKKIFSDSSYEHVNGILKSIQNSGYFEKNIIQAEEVAGTEGGEDTATVTSEVSTDATVKNESEQSNDVESNVVDQVTASALPVKPTDQPSLTSLQSAAVPVQQQQQVLPPQIVAAGNFPPMPNSAVQVRAVEHGMYKQQQQQQQFIQQKPVRPIHEVIGTPSFFFLQDSELDDSNEPAVQNDYSAGIPLSQISPQQLQQQQQQSVQSNVNQLSSLSAVHTPVSSIQQPPNLQAPMIPVNSVIPPSQQQQQQQQPGGGVASGVPSMIPTQTFSNQSFPSLVQPMFSANSLKSGEVTNIPPFVSSLAASMTAQQPNLQQTQQPTPSLGDPQNQLAGLRTMPAFVQQQQNAAQIQIAQMQNMIQSQQLAAAVNADTTNAANALTEKLKSTLQISDSTKPTSNASPSDLGKDVSNDLSHSNDWNDVNDQSVVPNDVSTTSWSSEMESSNYHSGGSGGGSYKRNTGNYGRSDNKYQDNKYQDKYSDNSYGGSRGDKYQHQDKYSDNKYDKFSNTFRSRNYQNGGAPRGSDGSGGNSFYRNNSYYSNGGGGGNNGNGLVYRSRIQGNGGGGNTDYNPRQQRPGGPNGGPPNNRNPGGQGQDRDNRGIKA